MIFSERKFKSGYIIRDELSPIDNQTRIKSAYNHNGDYIGDSKTAHFLCVKKGILPELIPGNTVCSIGFGFKDNKWYGWSHRAICGFKIGDMIFEEKFGDDHTPFIKHGRKKIKNMKNAKQAAINFANYIG